MTSKKGRFVYRLSIFLNLAAIVVVTFLLLTRLAKAESPDWISHTGRQVIGGDIIHWGTGDATTPDIALFKARHMAIKTLIEECGGVANKEIIPRKQYVDSATEGYRAYALVSLDFQSCEAAKRPGGKRLENPEIVESQKLYSKLLFVQENNQKPGEIEALKEIQKQIHNDIEDNASIREDELANLKSEIISLKLTMRQPIVPTKLPATNAMKEMCFAQYQSMMNNLTQRSIQYNGNMAAPELGNALGAADQQRTLCMRIE